MRYLLLVFKVNLQMLFLANCKSGIRKKKIISKTFHIVLQNVTITEKFQIRYLSSYFNTYLPCNPTEISLYRIFPLNTYMYV